MSASRSDMRLYQMALKNDYPINEHHLKLIVTEATKMLMSDSRKYKASGMRALMEMHAFNRRHEDFISANSSVVLDVAAADPRCRELMDELAFRMAELTSSNGGDADEPRPGTMGASDASGEAVHDAGDGDRAG